MSAPFVPPIDLSPIADIRLEPHVRRVAKRLGKLAGLAGTTGSVAALALRWVTPARGNHAQCAAKAPRAYAMVRRGGRGSPRSRARALAAPASLRCGAGIYSRAERRVARRRPRSPPLRSDAGRGDERRRALGRRARPGIPSPRGVHLRRQHGQATHRHDGARDSHAAGRWLCPRVRDAGGRRFAEAGRRAHRDPCGPVASRRGPALPRAPRRRVHRGEEARAHGEGGASRLRHAGRADLRGVRPALDDSLAPAQRSLGRDSSRTPPSPYSSRGQSRARTSARDRC